MSELQDAVNTLKVNAIAAQNGNKLDKMVKEHSRANLLAYSFVAIAVVLLFVTVYMNAVLQRVVMVQTNVVNYRTVPLLHEFGLEANQPDVLCPGGTLEFTISLTLAGKEEAVFFVYETINDAETDYTAYPDTNGATVIIWNRSDQREAKRTFTLPVNILPGTYVYKRALTQYNHPPIIVQIPFTVEDCNK